MKILNIDSDSIKEILHLMESNNGYITSKMVSDHGIHRMYLNLMVEKNIIERVSRGIYIDSSKYEDSYFVFSISYSKIIYSHMTALYFHGISIQVPSSMYDITTTNNYNVSILKKHNVFYVSDEIYELGLTKVKTSFGNEVNAYDMERCICDIIRSIKRMDIEHVKYSVKEYLKRNDKDMNKLSKYAEKIGIKDEVMNFVSMMYE